MLSAEIWLIICLSLLILKYVILIPIRDKKQYDKQHKIYEALASQESRDIDKTIQNLDIKLKNNK